MTKRTLLIAIPVVALLVNGLGYLIVGKMRVPPVAVKTPETGQGLNVPAAAPSGAGGAERTGAPAAFGAQEDRAFARRATGLAALEAGDYSRALGDFTEAQALLGDRAHVDELIRVTEELRRHSPEPAAGPRRARAPASTPVGAPNSGARGTGRRVATREENNLESTSSPAPVPAPAGLLIVTTTPRGLLVQIDDSGIDLTPMRTKMRPGSHRIALLDGDRKLYETTVEVKDGTAVTLQKDLSAEIAPAAPRGGTKTVLPTPREPPALSTPAAAPAPSIADTSADVDNRKDTGTGNRALASAATPDGADRSIAASAAGTGALSISSPGLYGVVWVNGRPRGYPPLRVSGLPAGRTRVDVRVNGIQKRSSTVVVQPGSTTAVEVRNQEAAP